MKPHPTFFATVRVDRTCPRCGGYQRGYVTPETKRLYDATWREEHANCKPVKADAPLYTDDKE